MLVQFLSLPISPPDEGSKNKQRRAERGAGSCGKGHRETWYGTQYHGSAAGASGNVSACVEGDGECGECVKWRQEGMHS